MNTLALPSWLRLVGLTLLVWFGPSVLVLQHVRTWADVLVLRQVLPIFPGLMVCNFAGRLFGRLPDAVSLFSATLVTLALVGGTLAILYRCHLRSSEWLPLLAAFVLSGLLWWAASTMLAA